MLRVVCKTAILLLAATVCGVATNSVSSGGIAPVSGRAGYFWKTTDVAGEAQLVTLFCDACNSSALVESSVDIPLISVMRDTLGDKDPGNDRLTAIWLLSYIRPSLAKQFLSAVPFFYWRVGAASPKLNRKAPAPLLDMTSPQHPMFSTLGRDVVQWGLLDSVALPVRASSRAYRSNEADNERLHLEEAESYLRSAPGGEDPATALSHDQIQTLIARLELRKTLLGGLANETAARRLGAKDSIRFDTVRTRNWELLRQWADKTGLIFEPITLAHTAGDYAMLWYSPDAGTEADQRGIWKLLGLKRPAKDAAPAGRPSEVYWRAFDQWGNILPFEETGVRQSRVIPLGVYSLTYPKQPLLVLDFRTGLHIRLHEISQRAINEVTAGLIGISHFTNWYYYVAADAYDFVASRHGSATNEYERLDSYSQFRTKLKLDEDLDSRLRAAMEARIGGLSVNPLESDPRSEMRAAVNRYGSLQEAASDGRLATLVDKDRRAELAQDRESPGQLERDNFLHLGTLGFYTHRAAKLSSTRMEVNAYRRAQVELAFLDSIVKEDTAPEVAFEPLQIQRSVESLGDQLPHTKSRALSAHAAATLSKLDALSQDAALKRECGLSLMALTRVPRQSRETIALKPAVIHNSRPNSTIDIGADRPR